jgi:N-acetylmuramoyl-L-alanine amidase
METSIKTTSKELSDMDNAFLQMQESYKKLRESFLYQNHKAKSNWCIGVSAGHGGFLKGEYLTKGKQFHHEGKELHYGGYFYEGVWNRIIADKLCARLKEEQMVYKKFYHEYEDWSLEKKSNMVNHHHVNVQKVLLFELHSNGSSHHNAEGFSVYTSPGQTDSDVLATKIWEEMEKISNKFGFKMRKQSYKDGDVDYEEKFWMCVKTACPTILLECLFFDYLKDVEILMNEHFQNAYVEALLLVAMWADKNM